MLEALGLDETTETVYRAMLANRSWGVEQLSSHLGLSETRVRATLDTLAELTLVRQSVDDPGELRLVDPKFGLESLLQAQQAQLLRRQQEFAESQAAISGLIAELESAVPRTEMDQLRDIDEIQTRLEVLADRATRECLSFMPGGAQSPASIEAGRPLNESALRRGVAIRTVYLDSVRNDIPTFQYARWLTELGGEIRTVPTLPVRLLVVDREVALVPVNPDNGRDGAVQLTGTGIIAALVALFDQTWAGASPFGRKPAPGQDGLSAQERELLNLLDQGMTDEAAGKRLGLSLRTVRRMMADLMERLDARSRFEAGARAAARGWLQSTTD
nr:LuxR C-terminal-related transcriptional regulator [Kibdelosporangium sp. MJ126-NF4]CEL20150.1 regulatory protein [Kibdelosporangium sp. MJ126-NF4]CTQ97375.1 regulatory protein [Kibdelosporangium sp. MJ126-NF4]